MEGITLLVSIFAMIAVPLSVWITIQYCIYIGKDLGSVKLMLFSVFSALVVFPFTIFISVSLILNSLESVMVNPSGNLTFLTIDLGYIIFGWLVCSALYGELIVPKFSQREIKLP